MAHVSITIINVSEGLRERQRSRSYPPLKSLCHCYEIFESCFDTDHVCVGHRIYEPPWGELRTERSMSRMNFQLSQSPVQVGYFC